MRTLFATRPSPAMVVACLALLVALSGTGIAAVSALAPNSVGTAQLKSSAVTNPKLASGAVTSAKVRNSSLRRVDFAAEPAAGRQAGATRAQPVHRDRRAIRGVIGAIAVRTASTVVPGGVAHNAQWNTRAVQKTCDPGEKAIAGGRSWSDDVDDRELPTIWLKPVLDASNNVVGCSAKGGNDSGNSSTFTVHALCYKREPPAVALRSRHRAGTRP